MGLTSLRRRSVIAGLFLIAVACATQCPAGTVTVVDDHFDGSSLSSNWKVDLLNANGATYSVANSNLTVTAIDTINPDFPTPSVYTQGYVTFSQSFAPLSDFVIRAQVSWNESSVASMQTLGLQAIAAGYLGQIMFDDSWILHAGQPLLMAGSNGGDFGSWGEAGLVNSATFEISRTAGVVAALWYVPGINLPFYGVTASSDAPLTSVALQFQFMKGYDPGMGNSLFGPESVDRIVVSGTPVPASVPVPNAAYAAILLIPLAATWRLRHRMHRPGN